MAWPYREYSEVFFGQSLKVLRGGAWSVDPVACRGTFRNWDLPIRRQIFAGFRCARDGEGRLTMCRHLAYVGTPRTLHELLIEPEWSLVRQSYEPRRQLHGIVNADGFGAGWYSGDDPTPARYRRDTPIWSDESFRDVARTTSSRAVLAAVRSASEGTAHGVEAAAPFAAGRYLFSHNGRIEGWPTSVTGLADKLPTSALLDLVARTDSALLWALTQEASDSRALPRSGAGDDRAPDRPTRGRTIQPAAARRSDDRWHTLRRHPLLSRTTRRRDRRV